MSDPSTPNLVFLVQATVYVCHCRFVTQARELGLPIAILNIGATRADKLATLKIEAKAGDVLPRIIL